MKLIRSDSVIRITDFSWLWAAIGFPAGIACLCGLAGNLYRGIFSGQTTVMLFFGSLGLGVGIILTRWSEFRFDKTQQAVTWKRRQSGTSQRRNDPFRSDSFRRRAIQLRRREPSIVAGLVSCRRCVPTMAESCR